MKHPAKNVETFEFNLGQAPKLRCNNTDETTVCGSCEACILTDKLNSVKTWFLRAGDQSKRRYALGLVKRCHSVDLVQYVINLLQPLLCKDFTYARMRTKPSLETDRATMSEDRALAAAELEKNIAESWFWFQAANYWTKSNFLLGVLRCCDAHLLHAVGTQARTLLASERKAFVEKGDYENQSVASTTYTYDSTEKPEFDLLSTVCSEYSQIVTNPFDPKSGAQPTSLGSASRTTLLKLDPNYELEIYNDDSGGESLDGSDTLDPTCMVVPGSAKAYAGVSKYRDFIRSLPVHLSKYILSFLDQVSLFNCVCVSKHWRIIVEEVHKEFYVNQQVREEVMLMQGAAAQGCNPVYAKDVDVMVPNIALDSWQTIRSGDDVMKTMFKSEVNFRTAYSGYSTRNIIMEERNVYCGAYNVMVLTDQADGSRVVDTNGGKLIAIGSQDRKIRFIGMDTAQEMPLVCTGHAGSVRCVALQEKQGFVLSGSYDTSIRKWSLETGKCQTIFRGHRDTILCLKVCNDKMISGAKDHMCKVWLIDSGKCIRTFKHKHPVTAVTMGEDPLPEIAVSGCEAGKVKVWDLKSGQLIKKLSGHHGLVTDIKFDKWHIVTGSKDGYSLVWSAQGDHARCLTALRHPKEVLCLEFMYLRVITGSADGKLRIWNMVTAQCLRIMRGNSRSDPISQLIAIGNMVTINTSNNLLVLNFEPVEYDYTLEDDKMPPLVQYSKYADTPIRSHPYPYVRAQRMNTVGATNQKILTHSQAKLESQSLHQPQHITHSAKSLSRSSLRRAKRIQSAAARLICGSNTGTTAERISDKSKSAPTTADVSSAKKSASAKSVSMGKPPSGAARLTTSKSRAMSTKSGTQSVASGVGFQLARADADSDLTEEEPKDLKRRVSWAFNNPIIPKTKELSLSETKSLLRSQIRVNGEAVPPDFIYLTVNAIQANMRSNEASKNMEINRRERELALSKRLGRPLSSPSRIDPRTKVPVEEIDLDQFLMEHGLMPRDVDGKCDLESRHSAASGSSKGRLHVTEVSPPSTTVIVTEFAAKPIDARPNLSLHSKKVKSSIPGPRVLRPHTATIMRMPSSPDAAAAIAERRPHSAAIVVQRPGTGHTTTSTIKTQSDADGRDRMTRKSGIISSGMAAKPVPMMMYSNDLKKKLELMREQRAIEQMNIYQSMLNNRIGNVSHFNDPMRSNSDFNLLTYKQTKEKHRQIAEIYENSEKEKKEELERQQRQAWLAKVKGLTNKDFSVRPKSVAPEIKEYAEIQY